jgi:hypothetical protein
MKLNSIGMKIQFLICAVVVSMLVPGIGHAAEAESRSLEEQVLELRAHVEYLQRVRHIEDRTMLTDTQMRDIVTQGAKFLVNALEEDGHFKYEYEPYKDDYLYGDNIVRQAGALYELGELVRNDPSDKLDLSDAIALSIARLEELSRVDTFLGVTFRCIVEEAHSDRCKLGATSLALIGILSYVEVYPEKTDEYKDLIKSYVSYIIGAKSLRTGFRDVHIIGSNAQPSKQSSFSNGEALLALIRYTQYQENSRVTDVIDDTFAYLKDEPYDSGLYLWIMAALKDLQNMSPDDAHVAYVKDYTSWRIARVMPHKKTKNNYCAYVEGIASAYSILDTGMTVVEREGLRNEIDFWNKRNSRLQIGDDDIYRMSADGNELELDMIPDLNQSRGGFLTSDNVLTQRIDFTQHCISAYLQTLVDIDGKEL